MNLINWFGKITAICFVDTSVAAALTAVTNHAYYGIYFTSLCAFSRDVKSLTRAREGSFGKIRVVPDPRHQSRPTGLDFCLVS